MPGKRAAAPTTDSKGRKRTNLAQLEVFARELHRTKHQVKSAMAAGYSEKYAHDNAYKLARDPYVLEVIAKLEEVEAAARRKVEEERQRILLDQGATPEWVLRQLVENVQMAKAAVPVFDAEGNPTGEYKTNLPAANKALELIGTELGMFVKTTVLKRAPLEEVPEHELDQLIEKKMNEAGMSRMH